MSSSNGEELLFGNAEGTKVWCLADELYTPLDNQGHWTKVKGLLPDDAERRDILRMLAGLQWDGGGNNSELYHYLPNTGRWEAVTPYPHRDFFAIASTPGGAQVWAEGLSDKEVVHFPSKDNQWELQPTEGHYDVRSFFITNDGNAGWSVGVAGQVTQLVSGRWERNNSGTSAELDGISGSADASELWAVGAAGTILHYSALNREWRVENGPFIVQDSTIGDALTRNH